MHSSTAKTHRLPRAVRWLTLSFMIMLGIAAGFLGWQHYYPVVAAPGWSTQTVHDNIQKAAAIARSKNGSLLATEELPDSKGRLLSIDENGARQVLLVGLSKPDGLTAFGGGFAFSQEGGAFPVSLIKDGKVTPLFDAVSAQGMSTVGDKLYVVEDRKGDGRLFEYDLSTGTAKVLRSTLEEAESFATCPNGDQFYTEKEKSVVRRLTQDGVDPVFLGPDVLLKPSYVRCDQNGLWVVEDRTHLARVLLADQRGNTTTILSHLRAPQVLIGNEAGDSYLLAEGGRNRVIKLSKNPGK